jgi:hypothetical protein
MKKSIFAVAALLTLVVGAQANLLTNGDFNTGDLSGWWTYVSDAATQSITISSTPSFDSTTNVKLTSATDGSWQEMGNAFVCAAGTTYTLDLVYNSTGWVGAGINLKYMDSSWGYVNYEWVSLLSSSTEGTGTWTPFSYTFTTPAGTGLTEVKFAMGGWGSLSVDNVNVPEPITMLLLGLGGLVLRKR